jgi:predicted AlkP superfamily phosphohydrolase/phosphomutase
MELIFNGKTCKSEFIQDKQRICIMNYGYINLDENKAMYKEILSFMRTHSVVAFFHDLRELKGTFTQLNDWLIEAFKSEGSLSIKHDALVLNDDIFTEFATQDIIKKVKSVEYQIFKSAIDAEEWLDSKLI